MNICYVQLVKRAKSSSRYRFTLGYLTVSIEVIRELFSTARTIADEQGTSSSCFDLPKLAFARYQPELPSISKTQRNA